MIWVKQFRNGDKIEVFKQAAFDNKYICMITKNEEVWTLMEEERCGSGYLPLTSHNLSYMKKMGIREYKMAE